MSERSGLRIHITGVVQGVGFRPFVYGLAQRLSLTGWVRNTSAGVDIEAEGPAEALSAFARALQSEAPPLARIDDFEASAYPANGYTTFEIVHSEAIAEAFQPISPDVSLCPDCWHELLDPADRRYRYPFINCTNCGPRFTIIKDIPYDRPLTTMAPFAMCPACAAEYQDPLNRRFHAQPVACADCGPQVWLEPSDPSGYLPATEAASARGEAAIQETRERLRQGQIVAIKGLGGFHLACDATNPAAVTELRRRKLRVDKPFALMMPDLAAVQAHCQVDAAERALLESRQRPIVILTRRPDSAIAELVAPGQDTLGVMLPYTPLHVLLLERAADFPVALVMTSGNLSEEPIATDNDEARRRLARLADAFLLHDRAIFTRCDDSVVRAFPVHKPESEAEGRSNPPIEPEAQIYPLRRARGYAPFPVRLPWEVPPLLAAGAELKNAFCLTHGRYAFMSHHIGDLENYETLRAYEDGVAHFERLFRIQPVALAYDLHPDYLATRYALERAATEALPSVGVQHHHAHIAAGMAEHGLSGERPVLGVSFDGTGYGADGAIWGGEFLIADFGGYQRPYHLAYCPMPGGEWAIRQPWRLALAWLDRAGLSWDEDLAPVRHALDALPGVADPLAAVRHQLRRGINAPQTSSIGRLFDAVSSLAGVRQEINYEAQAAIELEALADRAEEGAYPLAMDGETIDPAPMIQALVADLRAGVGLPRLSARFHNGLARMVVEVCGRLRSQTGLSQVVLSGGVWQNMTLLAGVVTGLEGQGFEVLLHRQVPANDGGLALGQAAVAAWCLEHPGSTLGEKAPDAEPELAP